MYIVERRKDDNNVCDFCMEQIRKSDQHMDTTLGQG